MERDVSIVRIELPDDERELRGLLEDYFTAADEKALERFGDVLSGLDVEEAAESDLERLRTAAVDEPLFLARDDDRIVGFVQLKRLGEATAEVKRLYVVPSYREQGLGRRLMERLIDGARDDGFTTLRLGVGPYLEKAQTLYEDIGFEFTPPYEQSQAPEAIRDEWCFMRCSLDEG